MRRAGRGGPPPACSLGDPTKAVEAAASGAGRWSCPSGRVMGGGQGVAAVYPPLLGGNIPQPKMVFAAFEGKSCDGGRG